MWATPDINIFKFSASTFTLVRWNSISVSAVCVHDRGQDLWGKLFKWIPRNVYFATKQLPIKATLAALWKKFKNFAVVIPLVHSFLHSERKKKRKKWGRNLQVTTLELGSWFKLDRGRLRTRATIQLVLIGRKKFKNMTNTFLFTLFSITLISWLTHLGNIHIL